MTEYTCKSRFLHNPRIYLYNEVQKTKCLQTIKLQYQLCDLSFDWENGLERHLESVHENMQYHCDKCEQSLNWEDNLEIIHVPMWPVKNLLFISRWLAIVIPQYPFFGHKAFILCYELHFKDDIGYKFCLYIFT